MGFSGDFAVCTERNGIMEYVITDVNHALASRLVSNLKDIYADDTLSVESDD